MFEVTKACGAFMKLLEEQLDRVAGMNEEKTDFSTKKQITITDKTTGTSFNAVCAFTDRQKAILKAGGLLNYTKEGGQ